MLLPLMVFPSMAIAQDDLLKIFEDFKKANEKEFSDFRNKANSEYSSFLRASWEQFEGCAPMAKPVHDEPVVVPLEVPEDKRDKVLENKQLSMEIIAPEEKPAPEPKPVQPIEEVPVLSQKSHHFTLYGTECSVRFDISLLPYLKGTNRDAVANYWDELSRMDQMNNLLYDSCKLRDDMLLCDWAFYKLTESLSDSIYPYSQDEAALFQAYVLTQAGFRLRLGYSDIDKHLHFIIATECKLYEYPYWELDSGFYYLLDGSDVDSMKMVAVDFEGSLPMRLSIDQENDFADNLSDPRQLTSETYQNVAANVRTNLNLLDFYNEYPQAVVNNDSRIRWRFYANVPASRNVREYLYPGLKEAVAGKSELEAADMLLNFVQTAFLYESDDKLWGGDRAFYVDESLYYPYCDCEDRSILFSRLVRDLLGLDVVLIYYPGHLATAVRFNHPVTGDYIAYKGANYTVCDPTYINARVGMTMPDMDNSEAFVIVL